MTSLTSWCHDIFFNDIFGAMTQVNSGIKFSILYSEPEQCPAVGNAHDPSGVFKISQRGLYHVFLFFAMAMADFFWPKGRGHGRMPPKYATDLSSDALNLNVGVSSK